MLHHLIQTPDVAEDEASSSVPVVVLLHGRGSDERDLQSLRSHLPEGTAVITPRAPFPGAPWGYGPGWAWYRYIAENRVVPQTLERSLQELDDLMQKLPELLEARVAELFLGGFSQGGTTSLAWALTRPGRLAGVINLSGFLVDHPEVGLEHAPRTPVFWGHGRADPNIPHALARTGREALAGAGADLTVADHPGGHHLSADEVDALRRWIAERVEGPEGAPTGETGGAPD